MFAFKTSKICRSAVLTTLIPSSYFSATRKFHSNPLLFTKASDLMVKCLEAENITHIFGVPGEENADFMMSLKKSSIQFVLVRHEQGAAFMAEVYGRLSGNPACCLGTLGPGATNLITGVANCNMDRAPMLVLTGQGSTLRLHKESHQIIDVVSMFRPVTKWAVSILHPETIPEIMRKAVRLARTEKPGAVLVELPEDVAKLDVKNGVPLQPRRFRRPGPDSTTVEIAYQHIRQSRRPIIIAGNGTVRKQSSHQLRRLCELTGIGVISTFMGKGAVDMDADYCLFTIGVAGRDFTFHAVDQADVVITVGLDMVEYPPRLWNPTGTKRVIHIDFVPSDIDANYHPEFECIGDLSLTLEALTACFLRDGVPKYDLEYQKNIRQAMIEEFAFHKDDDTEGSIRPQKALWDVREALGAHDILLSGVGAHKMWIGRYFQAHNPNTVLIPNGFCSMGLPLPGAIAASIVCPDKKIFAIAGDGDFLMNVQEMETARRLNSKIVVMVWEDGGYGLIQWKQDNEFGSHTNLAFGNPKWSDLAKAFGWNFEHVTRSKDLSAAIKRCLIHEEGPSLIVIPIDYNENRLLTKRLGEITGHF